MKKRLQRISMPVWLFAALQLALGAISFDGNAAASERRPVWQRIDQFVAIEKQDQEAEITPNDHPVQVPPEVLRLALGTLRVRFEKEEQSVPLFTKAELALLADSAGKAISLAGRDEDVTFAVIGLHPALMGLFKQPMVTTGRIFIRDGNLNLITGMVHEPVNDRDDRRLKPFVPGSRSKGKNPAWRLEAQEGVKVNIGTDRPDWAILSLAAATSAVRQEEPEESRTGKPVSAPCSEPAATKVRSIEERLLLLNILRDKELLTEEEFRTKRKEILDGI